MKVDNPNAFRFIMQDELYLLPEDKVAIPVAESPAVGPSAQIPQAENEIARATAEQPLPTPAAKPAIVAPATPALTMPAIKAMPEPALETPKPEFNYLGNNNKNFAVLVNYASDEHISAVHLAALESMLKRKELTLDDVAIFNLNKHQPLPIAKIAELLKPVKMLIMGKDALPHGIGNLPLNSAVQGKKTHVLYSFSFDEMMSSNENKKAFWEQMKTL